MKNCREKPNINKCAYADCHTFIGLIAILAISTLAVQRKVTLQA